MMHTSYPVRPFFRLSSFVWALTALVLGACAALSGGSSATSSEGGLALQLAPPAPDVVAGEFLAAWNRRDYGLMYSLLSPQSQAFVTPPVFQTQYEDVAAALGLDGVSYTIQAVREQGMTAAVTYDATFTSPTFGTLADPGRIMRLVSVEGVGWRLAWTSMDIFDGLAAGARVEVDFAPLARGTIFDRDGYPLVEDGTVTELYAQRLSMPDEFGCYALLGTIMRRDIDEVEALGADYNLETIFFVGDIDTTTVEQYAAPLADTCGITGDNGLLQTREDRRYEGHGALTHITGYVGQATEDDINRGYRPGDLIGQAGVEAAYETALRGQPSRLLQIVEPGGTTIRALAGADEVLPENVTLTIDRDLQLAAAQALSDAYNYAAPSWGERSPGGAVVIVDVRNGAILALASYPTFDPGVFSPNTPFPFPGAYINTLLSEEQGAFFNRATQGQYAPGSVFKIITTAAAANERLLGRSDLFYCGLQWENGQQYGDTLPVRLDWRASETDEEARFPTGDVTMAGALTSSCDPFFYEMGARLFQRNPNMLSNYARRFGLGQRYGLEMLVGAEAAGIIPTTNAVEEGINEAIGQGDVALPPLQMAVAVAAVANGGTVFRPYIVQQVGRDGADPSFVAQPQTLGELGVSAEALAVVRQGMCDVTRTRARNTTNGAPLGTAWFVFEDTTYSICGKTGTAQTDREPNAWFVAFVPEDNPQIAIVAMAQNSREGSEVAAPIVRRVLDDYLNVPPDKFAPFPEWWQEPYVPLTIAEGAPVGG